ncbi:sex hormone-binding globulin-like isoform X2 [Engystomops pustulosus]|uniref:sex hormone-binding globulin-like isoform X2 n=1 Tax=Engystomops pustulosus TaxID=76066 RepID=UPI003AFB4D72
MTTVIFLLILLLHKCRAETRSCHGGFLDPRTSMHIGQNWGHDLPAGTVHIDLHRVTRPFSAFEVRTYDPEGVLIFGDTAGGREWFLLGLRNGRPEIQIHNQFAKVTINGGRRINDGAWHKINSAMDGCIRNWVWLSLTPEWSQTYNPLNSSKLCFTSHQGGSYFAGSGKAIYRTRDCGSPPSEGSVWSLKIKFGLYTKSASFSLLTVLDPAEGPVLILRSRDKTLVLELGNTTSLSAPLKVDQNCATTYVTLEVTDRGATLQVGDSVGRSAIAETTLKALKEAWQGNAMLLIGSDPNDEDHFHGCLQDFQIQGQTIDLDFALYRSDSIWPHSCPGSA